MVVSFPTDLDSIFSQQYERIVNRDNTVEVERRVLQIEKTKWRGTLAGCRVHVARHIDGSWSVVLRPHLLGRYPAESKVGNLSFSEEQ